MGFKTRFRPFLCQFGPAGPDSTSVQCEVYLMSATDTGAFLESNKMYSHTDTYCIGNNCVPLYYTVKVCNVNGYTAKLGSMKNIKVGSDATLWTYPTSGMSYILEIH